eukprot:306126-Prorocentrum_minimum.AAC.5
MQAYRLAHELAGDLQSLGGHGGGEHAHLKAGNKQSACEEGAHLQLGGQQLEDVVNLVLETARKHLISLVENEALDVIGAQRPPTEHVVHATGGTHDAVHTALFAKHHNLHHSGSL